MFGRDLAASPSRSVAEEDAVHSRRRGCLAAAALERIGGARDKLELRGARKSGRRASAIHWPDRRARERRRRAGRADSAPRSPAHRRASSGSGTVGPEPITAGSSPGTSEIASVSTARVRAPARRPPLMRERCLRTVFISPMLAPERSSARVTACLSASATLAPARSSWPTRRPTAAPARDRPPSPSSASASARSAAASSLIRHRMPGFDHSITARRRP